MTHVFDRLIGQETLIAELQTAARSARAVAARLEETEAGAISMFGGDAGGGSGHDVEELAVGVREAMTHAWLFTGPPGSGRSIAAVCFAAALQCEAPDAIGCGQCRACTTVLAGTHGDVRRIVPDGVSILVAQIRDIVQLAARRPTTGRWQIVLVEDADRLTEQGANALLKAVEEPPDRTIFLLCAPSVAPEDIAVTLRSRCRHVSLAAPGVADIARVLVERDGVDPERARHAAAISGGHVGRARRLATDPAAAAQREQALGLARAATRDGDAYAAGEQLVKAAADAAAAISAELDAAEREELLTALGAGGTGKGTARAPRGTAGAVAELEKRQKSRATRVSRDVLDRALVDLAALFRDALTLSVGADVALLHPDKRDPLTAGMAGYAGPEQLLRCIEAVLACREALAMNVKPRFAVDAMMARLGRELRRGAAR